MSNLKTSLTRSDLAACLTEDEVKAWLETFYTSEVTRLEILKRLTRQAAFWQG